ncbi:hypothetical protein Tco_0994943 [Tanacetum coccineum]
MVCMNRKQNTKLDDAITADTSTPSDVLQQFTHPPQQGIETRKEPTVIVQNVGISANVRRRLSTSQPTISVNTSRLPTTAQHHPQTADVIADRDMADRTTVPILRIFDRFRNMCINNIQSDSNLQTGDEHDIVRQLPVTPFNHAYLCLDCKDCVIRPEIISFPNSRQENRPPNDLPAEHSCGHTRSTHNEVNATNKNLSTNVHRRKTTQSLPTAMSKEALSSRNTKRRSISASKRTPRNRNHPHVNSQTVRPNPERSRYSRRAEYHLCYGGGKMYMHPAPGPQVLIQQLLRNSHFMEHIRAYNQMFSMTSFGEKIDGSVNKGRGPYVFQISGQIYHWIGSLCLEEGHHPRFLQLYIHDTQDELNNRMYHFGGPNEGTLNPEIVKVLIYVLDEHNDLVQLFRTVRDRCNDGGIPRFKIRLYNMGGVRGYELPTSDILGGIVFESGSKSRTDFDMIIEFRGGPPQRINKLHQSYMSLQFPLLFIFGEPGFYPELTLKPRDGKGKGKKSRLDYIRKHHNDLRLDYLSGLYDVVSRGDCEGITAGLKIMLPSTFTGGPSFAEIPDPLKDPRGYKVVTYLMMHGPCGVANLGPDRILAKVSRSIREASTSTTINNVQINEIQDYFDGRFICLFEACWRIYDFPIHSREPAVQILNVHLEDIQRVSFLERDRLDTLDILKFSFGVRMVQGFKKLAPKTDQDEEVTWKTNLCSSKLRRPLLLTDAAMSLERM